MVLPCCVHGVYIGPWWVLDASMVLLWCVYGASVVPLWVHGASVMYPWRFHGGSWLVHGALVCVRGVPMVPPPCLRSDFVVSPSLWIHGAPMVPPWWVHVDSMVMPWIFHGAAMVMPLWGPWCVHGNFLQIIFTLNNQYTQIW